VAENPDPEKLAGGLNNLQEFLKVLNERLEKVRPGSGCQIGHAWFMQSGRPMKEPLDVIESLNEKVFPLLQEWFWDGDELLQQILQVTSEGKKKNSEYISMKGRLQFVGEVANLDEFLQSFIA
jgi:hypothetical protein